VLTKAFRLTVLLITVDELFKALTALGYLNSEHAYTLCAV